MKIELQEVAKKFKSLRALDAVSMSIEPGQVLVLLGPNGAGKTTLLRCMGACWLINYSRPSRSFLSAWPNPRDVPDYCSSDHDLCLTRRSRTTIGPLPCRTERSG